MAFSGGRGRNNLKLLRRIDQDAVLVGEGFELPVRCAAGEYEERLRTSITGSLEGDVSRCADGDEMALRLADGTQFRIRLIEPDEGGADFRSL